MTANSNTYVNEPINGLRDVLREFGTGNRTRRGAEVASGDLTTPGRVPGPLVNTVAMSIWYTEQVERKPEVRTYLYTDGDTGTTVNKHLVVPLAQTNEATVESVAAGDTEAVGASDVEHDRLFELNLLDVATPIALRVGAVRLLRDQPIGIGEHLRDVPHALNRLEGNVRA